MMIYAVDSAGRYVGVYVGGKDAPPVLPPDVVEVPEPPPHRDAIWTGAEWDIRPALPGIRREALARLTQGIDEAVAVLRTAYPETERETWDQQAAEAAALLADPQAPAPMIRQIAEALGVDPAAYAQGVAAKRAQFEAIGAMVVARRKRASAAIEAAQTMEEIDAAVAQAIDAVRAAVQQAIGG